MDLESVALHIDRGRVVYSACPKQARKFNSTVVSLRMFRLFSAARIPAHAHTFRGDLTNVRAKCKRTVVSVRHIRLFLAARIPAHAQTFRE
jgi:hypothetical protein